MKLSELIKTINNYHIVSSLKDVDVRGISCNSKTASDNFIFVAIKGNNSDGHKFIPEAINNGAKAIIVQYQVSGIDPSTKLRIDGERSRTIKYQDDIAFIKVNDTRKALAKLAAEFYGNPSSKIKVIGITGTNGKTTVSYLIEAILKEAGLLPAVIGTINYRFKDKVIPSINTTPGPLELQSMLRDMLKEAVDYAVMEVSSHALRQDRTEGINFHSAVFTNLTQDHLDYHKTIKNYFQAKTKLFRGLNSQAFAVINNDDAYAKIIKSSTKAKIITYGIKNKACVFAQDIKCRISNTQFLLKSFKQTMIFKTKLLGLHNVYNILAAAASTIQEGIDLTTINSAIEKFDFVPGRLEKINFNGRFSIFVDYAHTEDALANVIGSLRQLSKKRIIVVFGCGGERDRTKRPKMGRIVSELADFAIITNDNPRSEDPQKIISDIKKGIRKNNYCIIPERFEAIRKSLAEANQNDIVLIAGKGHENYQILKDEIRHFDDHEAVKECLKSMNY